MPELPEVQTVVNTLVPRVRGAKIRQVRLFRSDIVTPAKVDLVTRLTTRTSQAIERRGKRIVFTLEDGNRFYIHLGMSGRLTVESPGAAVVKHTHLILELTTANGKGPIELRFRDPRRFGGVFWLGGDDPGGDMGPEPLSIRADR